MTKTEREAQAAKLIAQIEAEGDREKRNALSIELRELLATPITQPAPKGSDTLARIFDYDLHVFSSYMKRFIR